ncbi:MAG: polyphosphate kinase 1 [Verrucomicrobiales bacterium]|nr:polyphosphate kinase 1 [Verrucomicrobiales bacterium]
MDASNLVDSDLFRSKEVSWLSFNARVLQEAADPNVPLLDRVRFLGIYSSNLDEFFRVRVATLKRLANLGKHYRRLNIPDPKQTLKEVNRIVHAQTGDLNTTYSKTFAELSNQGIKLVTNEQVPDQLTGFLSDYFREKVKPRIMPIMIKGNSFLGGLRDHPMYIAVRLSNSKKKSRPTHALLEIPDNNKLPRFVGLPKIDGTQLVIYLDDIIRFGLPQLFKSLPYDTFDSHAIKFTRDAEIELDDDITESLYEKLAEGLRERERGSAVRLNYDIETPASTLKLLKEKLCLTGEDTLFPGARYHNRKDLIGFPTFGRTDLLRSKQRAISHHSLGFSERHMFKKIRKRDILLHLPYHTFDTFLDLLREASMDPLVHQIRITQYRLANDSCVANALVNAVKNGKQVTVLVEPRARFDESRNIRYANLFQESGIRVLLGVTGLKVHAKLCLITRTERSSQRHYAAIGTGNFNEDTSRIYTDHMLLTASPELTSDVLRAFEFFDNPFRQPKLQHLVAAPYSLRHSLAAWIETEIKHAKKGRPAEIFIKINNLSDIETVAHLYRAAEAGVKIRIIARSMFSIVPGIENASENIEAIGIVDSYLEHSRVFRFANGGNPTHFISSADFLPRNFDSRFEIVCPIYDKQIQSELDDYLKIQWSDNVKARILDSELKNRFRKQRKKKPSVRSQIAIADHLATLSG